MYKKNVLNEIFNKYPKAETRFLANIAAVKSVTLQDIWKLFVDLTIHCDKYRKRSKYKKKRNKKKWKNTLSQYETKQIYFIWDQIQMYRKEEKTEKGIMWNALTCLSCPKFWQFIIVYSVDIGRPYSILQNFLRKGKGFQEFIATNLKYILSVSSIRYFPKDRLLKKKV